MKSFYFPFLSLSFLSSLTLFAVNILRPFAQQSNFLMPSVYSPSLAPDPFSLLDFPELLQLFLSVPHNLTFNYLPPGLSTWFCLLSAESEHNFLSPPPSPTPNRPSLPTLISKVLPLFFPALSLAGSLSVFCFFLF